LNFEEFSLGHLNAPCKQQELPETGDECNDRSSAGV